MILIGLGLGPSVLRRTIPKDIDGIKLTGAQVAGVGMDLRHELGGPFRSSAPQEGAGYYEFEKR